MRCKKTPQLLPWEIALSWGKATVAWEEEKEPAVLWGESRAELSCVGRREVHRAASGRPGAPHLLAVGRMLPSAFPTCYCFFFLLNQREASKYLDSKTAEGCWRCCTAFWGGSSCRWAVGKIYRHRRVEGREMLRQRKIKLRPCINFLLSACGPKRFLSCKRGSRACCVHLLWYPQ